jgi:hypothetical protein
MRADRIKNLWPKLEPKLRAVSCRLLIKFRLQKEIEIEELLPEAVIALHRLKSTKKTHYNLSYLITRSSWAMMDYLKKRKTIIFREIAEE